MTNSEIVMVFAVLVGPVSAVVITLWHQGFREKRARRLEVFRSLMKTRRRRLDPEHVSALNLVEIEFYGITAVESAFKSLVDVLSRQAPSGDAKTIDAFWEKFHRDQDHCLTALLDQMARALGYGYQQLEILKGGHNPQYYVDTENDIQKGRRLLANLYDLSSGRGLPIDVVDYRTVEQIRKAAESIEAMRGSADQ